MKRKELRVEKFLGEMDAVVPWRKLIREIDPYYKSEKGRRPHDLELMLRIHFLQLWHNLSDPGMEDALYDRLSFQKFLGFDCFGGDIPEMSSTKKNNKWHFGAKGHIGVQAGGRPVIHSVEFTTAKNHDKTEMVRLFHGEEKAIFGDSGYTDQADKRGSRAIGLHYGISDRGARAHPLSSSQKKRNRKLSTIRAKVEHPFKIIKEQWGHRKLRYKRLKKNASQFTTLCALCNIYLCRKQLIATGQVCLKTG